MFYAVIISNCFVFIVGQLYILGQCALLFIFYYKYEYVSLHIYILLCMSAKCLNEKVVEHLMYIHGQRRPKIEVPGRFICRSSSDRQPSSLSMLVTLSYGENWCLEGMEN